MRYGMWAFVEVILVTNDDREVMNYCLEETPILSLAPARLRRVLARIRCCPESLAWSKMREKVRHRRLPAYT